MAGVRTRTRINDDHGLADDVDWRQRGCPRGDGGYRTGTREADSCSSVELRMCVVATVMVCRLNARLGRLMLMLMLMRDAGRVMSLRRRFARVRMGESVGDRRARDGYTREACKQGRCKSIGAPQYHERNVRGGVLIG